MCQCFFVKQLIQVICWGHKWDITDAAVCFCCNGIWVKLRLIDKVIKQVGFFDVFSLHGVNTSQACHVIKHKTCHVDAISWRGIVEWVVIRLDAIVQHWRKNWLIIKQIFANDDKGYASRSNILLCTGINQAKVSNIVTNCQNIWTHIRNDRHTISIWQVINRRPFNRIIGRQMYISCIWINRCCVESRNMIINCCFWRR